MSLFRRVLLTFWPKRRDEGVAQVAPPVDTVADPCVTATAALRWEASASCSTPRHEVATLAALRWDVESTVGAPRHEATAACSLRWGCTAAVEGC